MSLKAYKEKRNFKKTSEPKGKEKGSEKQLIFVVQKHDASHLHFDFRLELDGVLKSWAVPKGPSMNPEDKRLAMMVEDHPYDYKDFEGTIPKGNYGAGEVIVWDNGIYLPVGGGVDKKENERILKKALSKGDLKFVLLGKKLKGEFALVNMRKDEKSWLLIKKHDKYAIESDILKKNKSVISGNTIEKLKKINEARESNARKKTQNK
jgi:bifunctional non-homologous end joining protein LigD